MKTSIIILTYNNLQFTKQCIESIRKNTRLGTYEIIVVDNASSDGTKDWLNEQDDIVSILNSENNGFPKGCNQGIEASKGDNILLLNNDVIVTYNWLENMLQCLYSSENVGAVGPVSNNVSYYQQIPVNYTSLYELNQFATKYNVSNPMKWEERIKLIGFCMLIKRSVLEKTGLLDERFSPGNFEDDDLSLRIRNEGYKNILCKDTFIHHYGSMSFAKNKSYVKLIDENQEKFIKKWKFTTWDTTNINENLINLIDKDEDSNFNLLDIGCGCGANLLKIKNKYKNAKLFGLDKNIYTLKQSEKIAQVDAFDIKMDKLNFSEDKFDYIIMDNVLQLFEEPEILLSKVKKHLEADGKLLISVPNANNYMLIYSIASGSKLHKNSSIYNVLYDKPVMLFNYNEMVEMFKKCEYKSVTFNKVQSNLEDNDRKFINGLCEIFGSDKQGEYSVKEYIVVAHNKENLSKLDIILKSIEEEGKYDVIAKNITELIEKSDANCEDIIKSVAKVSIDKVETLNYVANVLFASECYEDIIPLLNKALEIKPKDKDTLYNMGYVLHLFNNDELAMHYLKNIEDKNGEVVELINEIKHKNGFFDEVSVKFILRRIENDIDTAKNKNEILEMFINKTLNSAQINEVVMNDIIKKESILNEIAILCYENELYDEVIPLLEKSYEINASNIYTIYTIGYILHEFGADEVAMKYLSKMENSNDEIKKLADDIRGDKNDK
ncbi:glycosyltransferase [Clostridium akagii]|uniref:glycosyltransferase n=1 Tax=Clostridium akagii TaxID=91623 RepID=UPI0006908C82|nr:glycosyltransferase [Clostridium akagii]